MSAAVTQHLLGRLFGLLTLAAFVLYGVGASLPGTATGAALILLNSAAVLLLGALGCAALWRRKRGAGGVYLVGRVAEALLLGIGVWMVSDVTYLCAMAILGIVGMPFCLALGEQGLLPEWLAIWGVIGYALLVIACLAELATGRDAALVGAVPGGLFEITAGVFLVLFGFGGMAEHGEGIPLVGDG